MKHVVIEPKKGWEAFNFSELREFKDLFILLSLRDVKLRYKQTLLGVFWVLFQPLVTVAIFSVIFGKLAKLPSDGVPYIIFVFSGLLPWLFFSQAIQRASNSLISDARLISRVYFPRILVPVSSAAAVVVDFLVMAAALFIIMAIYQVPPTWKLIFLPVLLLITFVFSSAMGIWLSAFNVYYRDFAYVLPFIIQVWMYASPIVYSGSIVPEKWAFLYSLNPISGIIDAFRWSILGTVKFPYFSFSISCLLVLISFFGSCYTFKRIERFFADVI
ncbi:MAG TPA: ABC transporter permease [Chlamydiales bacterium]|nr:ABC transporter permease [Chlamydiales bacterium]